MSMRFNVMIATHGRGELLGRTLRSLALATRPAGFERVLVVENGPPAGAKEVCHLLSGSLPLEYVHLAQAGKNHAQNWGLNLLREGFVLFLDDDVRVAAELFEAYAQAAGAHGPACVYGGPVLIDYQQAPPAWLLPHLPQSVRGFVPADPRRPLLNGWFLGINYGGFVQRILEAGGLNMALGPGAVKAGSEGNPLGDEMDLQARMYRGGCQAIYIPAAQVWHYVPRERCTPAWALHRHYRTALTNAMLEPPGPAASCLAGTPLWLWKRLALARLRAAAANLVPSGSRRLQLKLDYYRWAGHRRGLSLR